MITPEEKKELDKIKPSNYSVLVEEDLKNDGEDYKRSTIKAVYNGERENLVIALSIIKVFKREHKKHQKKSLLMKT